MPTLNELTTINCQFNEAKPLFYQFIAETSCEFVNVRRAVIPQMATIFAFKPSAQN